VLSSGDEGIVQLHISSKGQMNDYVALSYCWGGPQPLVTTTENIKAMVAGVSLAQLPRTLRDAVAVTRNLGVRYLWIDAL
jgi:hypothetical protein